MTPMQPTWQSDCGQVSLYLGDCRDILPHLGKVDAVVTDPPYDEKTHKGARYGFRKTSSEIDFKPLADFDFVPQLLTVSRGWVVCFCALEMFGEYKLASGESWIRSGFWRKPNGVPQFTGDRPGQPGEGIAIMHSGETPKKWARNGSHAFWEYCIEQGDRLHQTQKPIPLMVRLVMDFTTPQDTVLDCFCGSGTTGIACLRTGRKFIGIEVSKKYFDIAVSRIKRELAQPYLPMDGGLNSKAATHLEIPFPQLDGISGKGQQG